MAQTPNATTRGRHLNKPPSAAAGNLTPPKDLDPVAAEFWTRHAGALAAADLLSEHDLDTFAHLCQTWALLQKLEKKVFEDADFDGRIGNYLDKVAKRFMSFCKFFCLVPTERKRLAVSWGDSLNRHDGKKRFEFRG